MATDFIVIGMEQTELDKIRVYNDHGNIYIVDYYRNRSKLWETMTYNEYIHHHKDKIMQKLVYMNDVLTTKSRVMLLENIVEMLDDISNNDYLKRTEKTLYCEIRPINVVGDVDIWKQRHLI